LEGLENEQARLVTRLEGVAPLLRSVESKRPVAAFVADTFAIDIDRRIATLAFRAVVPLREEKRAFEIVAHEGDADIGGVGRRDEGTAELDKSAFDFAAEEILPFEKSSEPAHSPMQGSVAGLPFRTAGAGPAMLGLPARVRPRSKDKGVFGSAFPFNRGAERKAPKLPSKSSETAETAATTMTPEPALPMSVRAISDAASSNPAVAEPSVVKPAFEAASPRPAFVQAPLAYAPPMPSGAAPAAVAPAAAAPPRVMPAFSASTVARRSPEISRRAVVDLLAFDPTVPARLRRSKACAQLLADDRAPLGEKDQSACDKRDILRVLSCGTPLDGAGLYAAFNSAFEDWSDLDVPLLLVAGAVRPTMDEVETLRIAARIAKPLGGNDKRILAALAASSEALAGSAPPPPETAMHLYKWIESSTRDLSLPPRYFTDLVEQTLCESRSFKKRTLFGSARIRAEISIGKLAVPIYLPDTTETWLPLVHVFPAVALVELRPREDASEASPDALVALALGRVLRARRTDA
jgi:hypothetical protein